MKYTILGFSQEELIKKELDTVDALILRYFVDFKDTGIMSMEIYRDKPYYWIKYEALIKEIPIIKIKSKDALRRRLKKLEECNVLEHYHKNVGGSYSFYALGEGYKILISTTTQKSEGYDSKVGGGTTQKSEQNINLLNNSSIKDIYTFWNEKGIVKHKKLTSKMQRAINSVLKDYSVEDIKNSIINYYKILNSKEYYFNYKWTLEEFLKRGLEKFMVWEVCSNNFKSNTLTPGQKQNTPTPANSAAYDLF